MMHFIIGFFVCWFFISAFVVFSENFLDNGITLFDGWGTTILILPVIPLCVMKEFLIHRKNNKERKDK